MADCVTQHATLSSACASGQVAIVELLASLDETDLDAHDADGTSPLCAACTWDFEPIVRVLVDAGCDVNIRNLGTSTTALHVAAEQENGKIIHLLLKAGADPTLEDVYGRTPCDFASPSESIWPLFAARGLKRIPKEELIRKGILRKVVRPDDGCGSAAAVAFSCAGAAAASSSTAGAGASAAALPSGAVLFYSRPGSAYVRSDPNSRPSRTSSTARMPSLCEAAVDPLGAEKEEDEAGGGDEALVHRTAVGHDAASRGARQGCVRADAATTWPVPASDAHADASQPTFSLWRS
tara:strand:+ start:632 stop:1513 length:882 start_codon:yes stop_codon:yes gene_type:complete